ncbi:DUF7473 family protein [Halonotius sp. GCM10025705]|uniref:DUF7473 family protein n=1 Tax=Halonotius sp. GCM10025705 TaxID=3252678 RepID=UPI00361BB5A4
MSVAGSSVLAPLALQTSPSPTAVLGTVGLLALFLSVTAHLAARNVLGEVAVVKSLGVGVGPAVVSTVTTLLSLPGPLGILLALAVDAGAIHLLYRQPRRTTALITAIHAIITVILGTVVGGAVILYLSAPG